MSTTFREVVREEIGALSMRWLLATVVARLLPRHSFSRLRTSLYRLGGLRIGVGSSVFGPILVWGSRDAVRHLTIGEHCRITSPFHAEVVADIHIGNRVTIGHSVILATANHDVSHPADRAGSLRPKPIVIEDGCWIGAAALILPGVRLGHGCVVGGGAVVIKDVQPNTIVAGVPARAVKSLQ